MTDKKKDPGLDDVDWDAALNEWDKGAFAPEVAKDKETKKAALPIAAPPPNAAPERPSRPLYRPPVGPVVVPPRTMSKQQPIVIPGRAPPPRPPLVPLAPKTAGRPVAPALPGKAEKPGSYSMTEASGSSGASDTIVNVQLDSMPTSTGMDLTPLPTPEAKPPPKQRFSETLPSVGAEPPRERDDIDVLLDAGDPPTDPSGVAIDLPPARARQPSAEELQVSDVELIDPDESGEKRARTGDPSAPLLEPGPRKHDPDAETSIRKKPYVPASEPPAPSEHAPPQTVQERDAPTRFYQRPVASKTTRVARAWLDDAAREAHEVRAEWLEREARATPEPSARARALLAVSELRAIIGDVETALALATEARDLAPSLPLAHRQVRALLASPRDAAVLAFALGKEMESATVASARVHAALLAADVLRTSGDDDGAVARWEQASAIDPTDVRAPLARAARALSRGEMEKASSMRDAPEMAPLAEALASALRLRGVALVTGAGSGSEAAFLANDSLRRAREALDGGDVLAGAQKIAELARIPELAKGAKWLAAALGAARSATRAESAALLKELVAQGEELARQPLAARAVELGDATLAEAAIEGSDFSVRDRAVLTTLLGATHARRDDDLAALATDEASLPLAASIASAGGTSTDTAAGSEGSRAAVRVGRLLAARAPSASIDAALSKLADEHAPLGRALALEGLVREGRLGEVSDALKSWGAGDGEAHGPADALIAAGLIAERAGDQERALAAYREARNADTTNEGLVRAVASLDPGAELPQELNELANELGEGVRGAIARLEAVEREDAVDDATRADLLERAHRAAPALPVAAFLAERIARRTGDVDDVLKWINERRAMHTDPLEHALDAVREALLIADRDPDLASARLEEAHRARPTDIALRDLYERLSRDPPADRGAWREGRAGASTGDARSLYYMEAAHEYERVGDKESALRAAEAAVASGDTTLARLARDRAEVEGGSPARLADELLTSARTTEDPRQRREAYERLADLDATGRGDAASALLWHRSILEETPGYKPSLRHLEHGLTTEGRDDDLEPIVSAIAKVLAEDATRSGAADPECIAHADLGARLRARGAAGDWASARELAELAAAQKHPSLASLRLLNAHARYTKDDATVLSTTLSLIERTSREVEIAALLVRAGEAASRLDSLDHARDLLERAKMEDPGDVVTWRLLADVRKRAGDAVGAADAYESLARTSVVPAHQLEAWVHAAHSWLDDANDQDKGTLALEQAAAIDVSYQDVYPRLAALYASRGAKSELAGLLERRIATVTDPEERVEMEVERGRALLEVGEIDGARTALSTALEARPDHTTALAVYADLCTQLKDWDAAEQAWVRLARLLQTPDEQRVIYERLGELYAVHSVNLSRAELAFKEVLKRAPEDTTALEKLVDVYKRQNDAGRATEVMQQLLAQAKDPTERRHRMIEVASIHETAGHDPRKAEQVLAQALRESPTDVALLRALAEFYLRHKQMPAVQILLDRAAGDARRAFAAGRFAPALFEIMRAVFEIRGKKDASNVVAATLAALDGTPATVRGGDARALDPRLDDLLAPEDLSPALRALLSRTGDALDAAVPLDTRTLAPSPLPRDATQLQGFIAGIASGMGIAGMQVFVSAQLGRAVVPASSTPPVLVIGDGLLTAEPLARAFAIVRALKLIHARASALVRTPATELTPLLAAWLQACNPSWKPEGVNPAALANAAKRITAALPRNLDADVGMMALEIAATVSAHAAGMGASALAWANRAALLAVGDPNAALDGIAWSRGAEGGAPTDTKERATWISRTPEAKDLLAFSVSDAYAEARARLGLDK